MRTFTTLLALAVPVLACECRHLTVCELVQLPTVFIGEVVDGGITSIQDDPWFSSVDHVRFKVLESFRGLPPGTETVEVQITPTAGMCAPIPYYSGRKYLVVPSKLDGKFFDGFCYQGRDIEKAAEEVRQVREYFAATMPVNVHGQVAAARDSDLVDFLLSMGEAKPLVGVKISTSRSGKNYSAVTSVDGRFMLPLPAAGTYQVHADLKPYASVSSEISVAGRGCAIQNFGLPVDNTISGRVWDERGQPVKNAMVGLIDLDRAPSNSDRHAWFDHAYTEQPDLTFKFENVPIGRYLLVFNPDGPRSGSLFDLPLESTYFPLKSTRADARTVEVTSGGVELTGMDLALGAPVDFRQVVVRVRFPDAKPMKTAEIRCVGSPLEEGGFPWVFQKVALESGSVQFLAPANRQLRLEVRDAYGRDLKKRYASTHEPGSAAIAEEFVVAP